MIRISVALLLLCCSVSARAQTLWTVTVNDFTTATFKPETVDDTGVAGQTQAGAPAKWSWDQLVEITNPQPENTAPATFKIVLINGDVIVGSPKSMADEQVSWRSGVGQVLSLPLSQVKAIYATNHVDKSSAAASETEDIATLKNGDVIRGIVSGLSETTLTVRSGENASAIPLDTLSAVRFTATQKPPSTTDRAWQVTFADGSAVTATRISNGASGNLALVVTGGQLQSTLKSISLIQQLNGPVSWLSSRTPSENIHTPYLDTTWPARMNRTVTGEAIRFNSRTYAHGIGVHSRSRLTWALDGTFKAFRTQYALDGKLPHADVDVRVLLDDKVVHETKSFKAGTLADLVTTDLGNAKSLTLEVDFGAAYDVQDRFNWIEPALLKNLPSAPTTAPTTQP